jgi:hypothetical protein
MKARLTGAAIVLVLALAGCSGSGDRPSADPPSSTSTPDDDVPVADSPACDEVRAGIDAFNAGDFEGTVGHFEAAVPLAEAQDDGSEAAGDLVDAVHYYADLDAEQYLDASESSPEFAKYKAITLGQCAQEDDGSGSAGTDV